MYKVNHIIIFIFFIKSSQESGFQKELNVNIAFPPLIERRDNIPTGHLRPLGWQSRAEGPVDEQPVNIQPEKFWNLYINKSRPAVIRGLVLGSDAVDKWTDMYLHRYYGDLEIKVSEKKQTMKSIKEEKYHMKLKQFLEGYRIENWYLRGIMPKEMQNEASVPHLINCGPYIQENKHHESDETFKILSSYEQDKNKFDLPKIAQLVEPYFWLSAGETSSLIHSHPEHNLHCVLDGRKDFILIPSEQFEKMVTSTNRERKFEWHKLLDLVETYPHSSEWYSKIDVDMVNSFKYKVLLETIWYWASLRAGDCIYIPANYLHQVRSHGRSLSSSVYFKTLKPNENYEQIKQDSFLHCLPNAPLFEPMSTIDSHFLWTYTHSERHLSKRKIDLNDVKVYLRYLVKQEEKLYFENFDQFYTEISKELKQELDNLKTSIKEYINLNSSDYWNDFLKEVGDKETEFLSLDQILNLNYGLNRFLNVLNIIANYHYSGDSYKIKKDEL